MWFCIVQYFLENIFPHYSRIYCTYIYKNNQDLFWTITPSAAFLTPSLFIDWIFKTAILLPILSTTCLWMKSAIAEGFLVHTHTYTEKVFFMRLESFVLVNGDISAHLGAADLGFPRLKTLWFFSNSGEWISHSTKLLLYRKK